MMKVEMVAKFAVELAEVLAAAGAPVTPPVAVRAAARHMAVGKDAAMAVLVAAGVPMKKGPAGNAGKVPMVAFTVNGATVFTGWEVA